MVAEGRRSSWLERRGDPHGWRGEEIMIGEERRSSWLERRGDPHGWRGEEIMIGGYNRRIKLLEGV